MRSILTTKDENIYIYGGGLGDIIDQIYWYPSKYNSLMNLKKKTQIILNCHNPGCTELFQNHPKKDLLDIRNPGYQCSGNFGYTERFVDCNDKSIPIMYPLESDMQILNNLPEVFIVFSCGAGMNERTFPQEIINNIVKKLSDYPLYGIGRNYIRNDRTQDVNYPSPVINLVDKLSVPGSVKLIRKCRGLVTAHSAMHSAGNVFQPWQLLLYPQSVRDRYDYWKGNRQGDIYTHGTFVEYNDELINKFIEKCKIKRTPDWKK